MLAVPSILAHNLLATHLDVSFQIRGHYCLTSHLLSAAPQTAVLEPYLSAPLVFNDIFFLSRKIEGIHRSLHLEKFVWFMSVWMRTEVSRVAKSTFPVSQLIRKILVVMATPPFQSQAIWLVSNPVKVQKQMMIDWFYFIFLTLVPEFLSTPQGFTPLGCQRWNIVLIKGILSDNWKMKLICDHRNHPVLSEA